MGYYCDIVTPLQKKNGDEYFLTDLILDLWITPILETQELDRDEFELPAAKGLILPELAKNALATFERLKAETGQGVFPIQYLK